LGVAVFDARFRDSVLLLSMRVYKIANEAVFSELGVSFDEAMTLFTLLRNLRLDAGDFHNQ
jgi:hypothetical protein